MTEIRKGRNQQKSSMKPFYFILGAVAVLGIGFIAFTALGKDNTVTQPPADMAKVANSQELLQKARGVTRGVNTAPVKIMVFSDYMCPWCGVYATTIENQVRTAYVDTNKAVEIYYDFPLGGAHVHSFLAARAGRCAEDQKKFWEYHDVLFTKQRDWSFSKTAPTKQFIQYAADLGLDKAEFNACLKSDKHADVVEYNRQLGSEAGVNSTPTVFINGRPAANPLEWDKLKAEIDAAVGAGR